MPESYTDAEAFKNEVLEHHLHYWLMGGAGHTIAGELRLIIEGKETVLQIAVTQNEYMEE